MAFKSRSLMIAAAFSLCATSFSAVAAEAPDLLPLPLPEWYTEDLHQRIVEAGPQGLEVPLAPSDAELQLSCAGFAPVSPTAPTQGTVSAGGCMVAPAGCTMNFIFRDASGAPYIGTAGHCVKQGDDVVMQTGIRIDPTDTVYVTLAKIGRVSKRVDQGIGRDFGLVKIDPGFAVVPGIAGALGPTGVFCEDPIGQPVLHYGHGYAIEVGPGVVKAGEVLPDLTVVKFRSTEYGYNWAGFGLPGDSGSPVLGVGGLAVGNLTHGLGVGIVPIPGVSFGMTMGGIFDLLGRGYTLVTADNRDVSCTSAAIGLL